MKEVTHDITAVKVSSHIIQCFRMQLKKLEEDIQKETREDGQVPKITGTEFENRIGKALQEVGIDKDKIYHSPQKSPDFIITDDTGDKIGLEVKKTDSAKCDDY